MASEILRKLFSLGVLKQDNPLSVFLVTGTFILATENNTRENKKGITSSVVDQSQAYQRLHVSAVEQANILVQTDIENASCVNTEYIFYSVEAVPPGSAAGTAGVPLLHN